MEKSKRRKLLNLNYGKPKALMIANSLFKVGELVRVNTLDVDPFKPKGVIHYVERLEDQWFYTIQFCCPEVAKKLALWTCSFIPIKHKRLRGVSIIGSREESVAIILEDILYQDEEDIQD